MDYFFIGICCVIIIALLCGFSVYFKKKNQKPKATPQKNPVKCPVCQSNLFVGEQLYSKVFRPMKVPDQLMTISGCPHCFPTCEPGVIRICPVCHKTVKQDQSLTARLFNKSVGKKHVHILGCSNCRQRKDNE